MWGEVAFFHRELRVVSWRPRQCLAGAIKSFIPKGAFARHIAVSPHIPFNTAIENKEPFANDPLLRRHGSGTRNIANRFVRSSEKARLVKKTWTV